MRGLILVILIAPVMAGAKLTLTPQQVVDQVLKKAREKKAIELRADKADQELARAMAVYDWKLNGEAGYTLDQDEELSGLSNPEDRIWNYTLGLEKKWAPGTTFRMQYERRRQVSVLNSFIRQNSIRSPDLTRDVASFSLEQPLLQNFMGWADKLRLNQAQRTQTIAQMRRKEELEELALESIRAFWEAYVAKEQFKEAIQARKKYNELVNTVKKKQRLDYVTPGELARVRAEYQAQIQRVKKLSTQYLQKVDELLTLMRKKKDKDLKFHVEKPLPPVPETSKIKLSQLRKIRIARAQVKNQKKAVKEAQVRGLPRLNLTARMEATGVEENAHRATTEVVSGLHPVHFIGVTYEQALGSHRVEAELNENKRLLAQEKNNLQQKKDAVRNRHKHLQRLVVSNHKVAQSKVDTVEYRKELIDEQEKSYRQGRLELAELIRSYQSFFQAQFEQTNAVGNYRIALNRLAAVRDELLQKNGVLRNGQRKDH